MSFPPLLCFILDLQVYVFTFGPPEAGKLNLGATQGRDTEGTEGSSEKPLMCRKNVTCQGHTPCSRCKTSHQLWRLEVELIRREHVDYIEYINVYIYILNILMYILNIYIIYIYIHIIYIYIYIYM